MEIYKPKSHLKVFYRIIYNKNLYLTHKFLSYNNRIDIDLEFYQKANNLEFNNKKEAAWHLYEIGIEQGLFYHPKQLLNINKDLIIYTFENELIVKDKDDYVYLNSYLNHYFYNKSLEEKLNDFKIIKIPKKNINCKILIILFAGNVDVYNNIIKKISNYKFPFNLLIVKKDNINIVIPKQAFIIETKEFGNDIIPTLIGYNFIKDIIDFDFILKIHTKNDELWLQPLSDFFLNKNQSFIIESLNHKPFICHPKFELKATEEKMSYERYLPSEIYQDLIFPAGSIYFTKKNTFDNIIKFINKIGYEKYFHHNLYDDHSILFDNSPIHLLERVVGLDFNLFLGLDYKYIPDKFDNELKKVNFPIIKVKSNKIKLNKFFFFKDFKKYLIDDTPIIQKEIPKKLKPNVILPIKLKPKKQIEIIKTDEVDEMENYYDSVELIVSDYYKNVSHYGGWKVIMESLNNKISNKVKIIDNVEYFFINQKKIIEHPWIGFVHLTNNKPSFLKEHYLDFNDLKNDKRLNHSLKFCYGLITFTSNIASQLANEFNIDTYIIKHPISIQNENIYNIENIKKISNNKNLLFLGQHLRKNYYLFKFEGFIKTWLIGLNNQEHISLKKSITQAECKYFNIKFNWDDINIKYFENGEDYLNNLKENIVIISCYESNANNSILEVIENKIPAFIEYNKEIGEYIGDDYPGFFNNYDEILTILNKSNLDELLYNNYKYLDEFNKNDLLLKTFLERMRITLTSKKYKYIVRINNLFLKTNNISLKNYYTRFNFNKKVFLELDENYYINKKNLKKINNILENRNIIIYDENNLVGKIFTKNNLPYEFINIYKIGNKYNDNINLFYNDDVKKLLIDNINIIDLEGYGLEYDFIPIIIHMENEIIREKYIYNLGNYFKKYKYLETIDINNYEILQDLTDYLLYRNYGTDLYEKNKFYSVSEGSIGLILSHLILYNYIKINNIKKILILEDDIIFNKDFENMIKGIDKLPSYNDIYLLGKKSRNNNENELIIDNWIDYNKKNLEIYGTHSLLINNDRIIDYLIDSLEGFKSPLDIILYQDCNLRIMFPKEDLIITHLDAKSTITKFAGYETYDMWNWNKDLYDEPFFNLKLKSSNMVNYNWNYITKSFEDLPSKTSDNIVLFDFVDKEFLWGLEKNMRLYPEGFTFKWKGIIHHPYSLPNYWKKLGVKDYINSEYFVKSLKSCEELFVFSLDLKQLLEMNINIRNLGIKITNIYHPLDNYNKYVVNKKEIENIKKEIIFVGWSFRNFASFYKLETNYKKIFIRKVNKEQKDRIELITSNQLEDYKKYEENIEIIENLNNEEYYDRIESGIIFLDYDNVVASNTILEGIKRNIPMIVPKMSSIIEYLGKDYPLYTEYIIKDNKLDEINIIKKVKETIEYLKTMNKERFNKIKNILKIIK